jgi:hypothetical protein
MRVVCRASTSWLVLGTVVPVPTTTALHCTIRTVLYCTALRCAALCERIAGAPCCKPSHVLHMRQACSAFTLAGSGVTLNIGRRYRSHAAATAYTAKAAGVLCFPLPDKTVNGPSAVRISQTCPRKLTRT